MERERPQNDSLADGHCDRIQDLAELRVRVGQRRPIADAQPGVQGEWNLIGTKEMTCR